MAKRENFGSKIGAILVAAGSAVGLGNIWRFPVETGQNGGAAYIIIYIACIIVLGIPIMMSEFLIGRNTHSNTAGAYQKLAPNTQWKWVGRLGVLSGFLIYCYYSVVAGWTLEYAGLAIGNQFEGKQIEDFKQIFADFSADPVLPVVFMAVFFLATHFIVVKGVKDGIERFSKMMMPALFVITVVLVICSVNLPKAGAGIDFLLHPDFSKLNGGTVLNAMGQAFFSLSLGLGCLCTYASYFDKDTNLLKTTFSVCSIDTAIAILAGFIIFPAVFNAGMSLSPEDVGPSLIFITLPSVFQEAFVSAPVIGYVFSIMFYLLLILASLTSTISMLEVVNAYVHEEFHIKRSTSALIVTLVCMFFGVFCALSFGVLRDFTICGMTVFGLFDYVASNILLPVGGMCISIFAGWKLNGRIFYSELTNDGSLRAPYLKVVRFMLRYIIPPAIALVLLNMIGVF